MGKACHARGIKLRPFKVDKCMGFCHDGDVFISIFRSSLFPHYSANYTVF